MRRILFNDIRALRPWRLSLKVRVRLPQAAIACCQGSILICARYRFWPHADRIASPVLPFTATRPRSAASGKVSGPFLPLATDCNQEVKKLVFLSGTLRTAPRKYELKTLGIADREAMECSLRS